MEVFIVIIKAVPCCVLCIDAKNALLVCYCSFNEGLSVAALDYFRSGDAKNFPWRLNPTADLLLLPNLGVREDFMR